MSVCFYEEMERFCSSSIGVPTRCSQLCKREEIVQYVYLSVVVASPTFRWP